MKLRAITILTSALLVAGFARGQAPQIALTFDDLPAHGPLPPGMARPEPVRSILATLEKEKMPPTFGFVNGFRLTSFPYQVHILQAWEKSGQPLGNHTWSHPELDKLRAQRYEANIAKDEPTLQRVFPKGDWHWFRFPYLEEGDTVAKREHVREWLTAHGYRIAEISDDFQDYNWNDSYARCATKHDAKAIAHLHDTYLAGAAQATKVFRSLSYTLYGREIPYILLLHVGAFDAHMLPELIAQFRAEGFTFVTLPEAAADPAYAEDAKVKTPGGSTFLEQIAAKRGVRVPELPDYSDELEKACR